MTACPEHCPPITQAGTIAGPVRVSALQTVAPLSLCIMMASVSSPLRLCSLTAVNSESATTHFHGQPITTLPPTLLIATDSHGGNLIRYSLREHLLPHSKEIYFCHHHNH